MDRIVLEKKLVYTVWVSFKSYDYREDVKKRNDLIKSI